MGRDNHSAACGEMIGAGIWGSMPSFGGLITN